MPFSYLKPILIFLASLLFVFGLAGMISTGGKKAPITQMGFSKGLEETDVQQQAALALDQPGMVSTTSRKKFAVIIGIVYDNYDLGTVSFADKDAESMYNLLVGRLGFPRENVIFLRNSEASHQSVFGALDWLANNPDIDGNSDVIFFYSGHGLRSQPNIGLNIPNVQSAYALVPFDFKNFDYKMGQGLLWDSNLKDFLGKIHAGRTWINIDSCFSGGFNQPGITGPNRVVTMSSQGDQLSSEIPDTQRGVLMQYMVEDGIAKGLSVEDAFAVAAPRAFQYSGQNPQIADEYAGSMDLGKSLWAPNV